MVMINMKKKHKKKVKVRRKLKIKWVGKEHERPAIRHLAISRFGSDLFSGGRLYLAAFAHNKT